MQAGKTWAENLAISPIVEQSQNVDKSNAHSAQSKKNKLNSDGKIFYEKPIPKR